MIKLLQKIVPFLNESIPEDLALKGIGKVSPKIHSFLNNGISKGLTLASGLAFLRSQLSGNKEEINPRLRPDEQASQKFISRENATRQIPGKALDLGLGLTSAGLGASALGKLGSQLMDNLGNKTMSQSSEQFSIRNTNPRLAEEIETTMSRGYDPLQTSAVISNSSRFSKDVRDLQKKTNRKIEDLIADEFGVQPSIPQTQNTQGSNWDQVMQRLESFLAK